MAVGVGLLLLAVGKKASAATPGASGKRPLTPDEDGAALMKRANQPRASDWATVFVNGGANPIEAGAFTRWAGIESSGNATKSSTLNERGLMQAGPQSVTEGALTNQEWAALINPATTKAAQAGLAVKYVNWLWHRAEPHITDPPTDIIDQIWYAKLYHQWPVDVRDGHFHGEAIPMSHELATRWADDARRMHRLRAANVVAFGTPTP